MEPCLWCKKPYERQEWQIRNRDWRCVECRRNYTREWRAKRRTAGAPVKATPKRPEQQKEYDETYRLRPAVRRRRSENERRYQADPKLRHKYLARLEVRRAVKGGKLFRQPCAICGADRVDAHHEDYGRPLDVMWLCKPHHRARHAAAKASEEKE